MKTQLVTIAAAACLMAGAVYGAGPVLSPGALQAVNPSQPPMTQVAALQAQVNALQQQVNGLEQQVAQLSTKLQETTKIAGDAKIQAGIGTVWINANGPALDQATKWVGANGDTVMAVVESYPRHTHGYQMANTTWKNRADCDGAPCSYITGNKVDNLRTTGPE